MERSELIHQIMEEIHESTEIPMDEMKENSAIMDDLDLSSLEIVMVISELEKKLHVKFPESELRNIVTIGDLADVISRCNPANRINTDTTDKAKSRRRFRKSERGGI